MPGRTVFQSRVTRIGLNECEFFGCELCAQKRRKIAVDLDRCFMTGKTYHFSSECCLSRADFNQLIAGFGINRAGDPFDPMPVMKKILSESFTGMVPSSHCCVTIACKRLSEFKGRSHTAGVGDAAAGD